MTDEQDLSRHSAGKVYFFLALLGVCFVLLAVIIPNLHGLIAARNLPPSWTGPELDTRLIHAGLLQAPHYSDTLRWWTGSWVMGNFAPFYRPLTSELFWLEWKVFGDRESLYIFPTLAAHMAATILCMTLIYRLAIRYHLPLPAFAACFAGWSFAGLPGLLPNRPGVVSAVALLWKNQPDSMAAVCCFIALHFYLQAQTGRQAALGNAVIAYLAACSFNEIAIPLPIVCAVLEWSPSSNSNKAQTMRRLVTMAAVALSFLVIRHFAISGPGYTYGANHEWLRRTMQDMLGPFYPLAAGEWLGNSVGLWIGAVLLGYRRLTRGGRSTVDAASPSLTTRWRPFLAGLIAAGGMSLLGIAALPSQDREEWRALFTPAGLAEGLLISLQPVVFETALASLALILSLLLLARVHRRILLLGFVWTIAFLAPLVVSAGPVHRFYLPQVGYILLYAFAASLALDRMRWIADLPRTCRVSGARSASGQEGGKVER